MTSTTEPETDTAAMTATAATLLGARPVTHILRAAARPAHVVSEPPRFAAAPWRCRHGWHAWTVVAVVSVRECAPGRWLCSLTQRCRRCPAVRHEQHRALSRRLRHRHRRP